MSIHKCIDTIIKTLILLEKRVLAFTKSRNNLSWVSDKLSYNGNTSHRCEKRQTNVSIVKAIFASCKLKIRAVVQVIGHMVSTFPAIQLGPLCYCHLQIINCKL